MHRVLLILAVSVIGSVPAVAQSLSDGLVAHYAFDATSGSIANDSSEHQRHATITGRHAWADGVRDGSIRMEGNAEINLGQPDLFAIETFTIAGWFRADDARRFRVITSRNRTWTDRQWWVTVWQDGYGGNPDGSLVFRMSPVRGAYVDLNSGFRVDDGRWRHFAVVVDSGARTASLFVDGSLVDSMSGIHPPRIPNSPAFIGRDRSGGDRYFLGHLDDLRFYGRALTEDEVSALGDTPRRFTDASDETGFNLVATDRGGPPAGIHFADFDADGREDALVTGSGPADLLRNTGEGFTLSTLGGWSRDYGRLALIDLTGNGLPDAYGLSHSGTGAFLNDGRGGFGNGNTARYPEADAAHSLVAADVEGVGVPGIFAVSRDANRLGRVTAGSPPRVESVSPLPEGLSGPGLAGNGSSVYSADLNNDGRPDFLYLYNGGVMMLSHEDGTYRASRIGGLPSGSSVPAPVAFGDFDNNGFLDAFVGDPSAGRAGVLLRNEGAGRLVRVPGNAGIDDETPHTAVAWGDFDNDGHLDLFIGTGEGAESRLYRNTGGGSFELADEGATVGGEVTDAVFVDHDHNGALDLAIVRRAESAVLLRNSPDNRAYLKARVVGIGERGTSTIGAGVRVELLEPLTERVVARRDIGLARSNGSEPLWAHFGGVDPERLYLLRVWFNTGPVDVEVVPSSASTPVGGRVIAQAVTVHEPARRGVRVVRWREISPLGED